MTTLTEEEQIDLYTPIPHKPGRPRIVAPPPEECIELGEDLVKWAAAPRDPNRPGEAIRFAEWYSLRHGFILKEWKILKLTKEFSPYYEKARTLLSRFYVSSGTKDQIKEGIAHRFLRHYCYDDVQEEENNQLEIQAKLKSIQNDESTQKLLIDKEHQLLQSSKRILELEEKLKKLENSVQS